MNQKYHGDRLATLNVSLHLLAGFLKLPSGIKIVSGEMQRNGEISFLIKGKPLPELTEGESIPKASMVFYTKAEVAKTELVIKENTIAEWNVGDEY